MRRIHAGFLFDSVGIHAHAPILIGKEPKMKTIWIAVNILLLVAVAAMGAFFFSSYRNILGESVEGNAAAPVAVPETRESLDLNGAIRFRLRLDALCHNEAVLVEAGSPVRFTLRPVFSLPETAPSRLVTYVDTHPFLEDEVKIDWKSAGGGTIVASGKSRFEFVPPEEGGDVDLRFRGLLELPESAPVSAKMSGEISIRLVCPVPWELMPKANRDLIGQYKSIGKNSTLAPYRDFYQRPSHFYRVTEANEGWRISPHFRLGDFDLRFDYNGPDSHPINHFPQYVALNPRLVVKMEEILSGLEEAGVAVDTLGILAGFRSPAYNEWKKAMGGVGGKYTKGFSTHCYGCAADFYVDRDGDGVMDDLNGDGAIDMKDAAWVRDHVVDAIDCQADLSGSGLAGMCGIYGEHDVPDRDPQSPNLHVDIRGYSINRWFINSRDQMVTDWKYWERRTCAEVLGEATGTEGLSSSPLKEDGAATGNEENSNQGSASTKDPGTSLK